MRINWRYVMHCILDRNTLVQKQIEVKRKNMWELFNEY